MAKVPNAIEISPKIWTAWVRRTNVTDDRETDGPAIAYSEREREFTFAKNPTTSDPTNRLTQAILISTRTLEISVAVSFQHTATPAYPSRRLQGVTYDRRTLLRLVKTFLQNSLSVVQHTIPNEMLGKRIAEREHYLYTVIAYYVVNTFIRHKRQIQNNNKRIKVW